MRLMDGTKDDVNTNSVVVACMARYERMVMVEINCKSQCVPRFCG